MGGNPGGAVALDVDEIPRGRGFEFGVVTAWLQRDGLGQAGEKFVAPHAGNTSKPSPRSATSAPARW